LERNWLRWKGRARLERIKEEEDKEEKDKESRIEEWNEEDELGNLWDPYNKLQKKFLGQEFLREGYCHELP